MHPDQTVSDEGGRLQAVAVLKAQLASASGLYERMDGSSRNVAGVGFIMLDESFGFGGLSRPKGQKSIRLSRLSEASQVTRRGPPERSAARCKTLSSRGCHS